MKKMPLIIIAPLFAVMIVVVTAFVYKMTLSAPAPVTQVVNAPAEFPKIEENAQVAKPSTFLGGLFGKAATPTPTPTLNKPTDLTVPFDDGGQADLDAITKDAAAL